MKIAIIYDSSFGNTAKIAQTIGEEFANDNVYLSHIREAEWEKIRDSQVFIFGTPTHAFKPTQAVKKFIKTIIPPNGLMGMKVVAYDTRIIITNNLSPALRFLARTFGYAAKPLAEKLQKKGGQLAIEPMGFFVVANEGPLREGELTRAKAWVQELKKIS